MEVEMDSSGKEGEVPVGRKSGHKGEVEDEAGKRRKIDIDGFVELQRVEGKEDAEKMEMDDIREREVVPKRDRYAADDRERRVGVVLVDWLCMAGAKESEKGGVGCEEAKTEPDAKYRRTEEVGHDSSNVQMEVEELLLHREVVEKPDHMMEVGGEAAKILEHETDKMGECKASKMDTAAEERKRGLEKYEQWRKRKEEEQMPPPDPEERMDPPAFNARSFEKRWNFLYANWIYGSFHDNTDILCMQFTFKPAPGGGKYRVTVQVFSVKIAEISGDLQWPIDVFGMIALRDSLDQNRNIIFERDRDDCQTLTEKDQYLTLTGPVRAVELCGPVVFEASLHARGPSKSEDKEISLLAVKFRSNSCPFVSILINERYTSRLTTLEFGLGHIIYSVEATIRVHIVRGPWPDGFRGHFAARTVSINKEVMLLDCGDQKLPVVGNEIKLSRRVVSVESDGILIVSVKASQGDNALKDEKDFRPQEMGTHSKVLEIGDCKMKVTVAWSLFADHPKLLPTH